MRTFSLLFLLGGCLLVAGLWSATAQDVDVSAVAAQPAPTPAAPQTDDIDIESLRKPGSTAKLFPDQPPATPAPGMGGTDQGTQRANRPGGILGRRRNSGRRRDVLVDQADLDPLVVRVAYRKAKTVAMVHDPSLAELLQQASDASTDPEKRVYLKQYYTRLYDSVGRIDHSPEMKKHLDTLRLVATSRYEPKRRDVGGDEDIVLGRGGGRRGGGRNR